MYKLNIVTSEIGNGQLFSFKALHLYTSILKFWSSVTEKNKNLLKIIKSYPRQRTLFYFVFNKWLIMGIFLDKHNFKSLTHTHFLMQKYPSFQDQDWHSVFLIFFQVSYYVLDAYFIGLILSGWNM